MLDGDKVRMRAMRMRAMRRREEEKKRRRRGEELC